MAELFLVIALVCFTCVMLSFAWIDSEYEEPIRRLETSIKHIGIEIKIIESNIRARQEIVDMNDSGALTDREFLAVSEKIGW